MTPSFRLAALSLVLLAGPLSRPTRAADGRIPISSAPFTISAPGSYYVTQDLTLASGNMITINASNVNLDLMNHTLTHQALTAGNNVVFSSGAYNNIRVSGGRITGGFAAVNIGGGTAFAFYQFDHLIITGQGFAGILMNPATQARVLIEDNSITAVAGMGLQLNNIENGRIERNLVSHCTNGTNVGRGIYLFSSNYNRISNNVSTGNQNDGIYLGFSNHNSLDWNTMVANGNDGFELLANGFNNIYSNNRLSGNTGGNAFGSNFSAGGNNAGGANF